MMDNIMHALNEKMVNILINIIIKNILINIIIKDSMHAL